MVKIITAVYENGVLRPLDPLSLREQQRVQIKISPMPPDAQEEEAVQTLLQSGLVTSPVGQSKVSPPSEEERLRLSRRLGQAMTKPLSEIIIEERGEK